MINPTKFCKEEHKELHKQIYNCSCMPIPFGKGYCNECNKAIIEFATKYGAGNLCQDNYVESLEKEVKKLNIVITSLIKKLEQKTKRVEELKSKINMGA